MPNQPDDGKETSGGPPLFEFVDAAHEVTEEERNRPRYGRPVRKPATPAPDAPTANDQAPPASA